MPFGNQRSTYRSINFADLTNNSNNNNNNNDPTIVRRLNAQQQTSEPDPYPSPDSASPPLSLPTVPLTSGYRTTRAESAGLFTQSPSRHPPLTPLWLTVHIMRARLPYARPRFVGL